MQRHRVMFRGLSLTLFRVKGVPVRAHWTLLLAIPYLTLVFSARFLAVAERAGVDPAEVAIPPVLWGLLLALGLFASVAAHELMHTSVALSAGGRVREITLMLLGGVSHVERMPSRLLTQAWMAGAGPLASLAIGIGLIAIRDLPASADLKLGVYYLGYLNVLLGVFNLLPAFPLDGGRVLRAALAPRLGVLRATRAAAAVGKVLSAAMAAAALLGGGLWLLFIALFLFLGADVELRAEEVRDALSRVRVADLIVRRPDTSLVPGTIFVDETLDDAIDRMRETSRLDLVVLDRLGRPVGILRASDLRSFPRAERTFTAVIDAARPLETRGVVVAPSDSAADAFERAAARRGEYLFVVEDGRLVGVVGRAELESVLALRALESARPRRYRPKQA